MKKDALTKILLAEIKQERLPAPVPEHRFHSIRKWRFDLAWPSEMLAMEIDGAVYTGGRHTRGKGYEGDCEKLNEALLHGWRVLRYSTGQVKKGYPIADLKRALGGGAPTVRHK